MVTLDTMCVLALAWKAHPRWHAVLIGNRDEFHQRPSAPLGPWIDQAVLAGRDLRAGGSWLATDGRGRLGALTNVRDPRAAAGGPSRGALVTGFLSGPLPPDRHLDQLEQAAGDYAPFNLLLADMTQAQWLGNHPRARQALAPGIHTLSNAALDTPWPKTGHLRQALEQWTALADDDLSRLWDALASRETAGDGKLPDTGIGLELERRLSPVFIVGPDYGTRASTILAIDSHGAGLMVERRFGPDGRAEGSSSYRFDGRGRFFAGGAG